MSYINFDFTNRYRVPGTPQPGPASTTVSAGFSREGGRLEFVERTTMNPDGSGTLKRDVVESPAVTSAIAGVFEAIRAAQWVDSLTVEHGLGAQPATVAWTLRNGGAGAGIVGSLPAPIKTVLDAAQLLEHAAS